MLAAGVLIDTRDTHYAQHCSTNDFAIDCKQTQTGFKRLETAATVCLVLNFLLVLGWTRFNPSITFSFSFSRYWIYLQSKLPLGRHLSGLSTLSAILLQSLHLTNPKYCEYSLLIFFSPFVDLPIMVFQFQRRTLFACIFGGQDWCSSENLSFKRSRMLNILRHIPLKFI